MILACFALLSLALAAPIYEKPQMIFVSGTEGYQSYRIPSITRTKKNTLLAICEGRVHGPEDYGEIHLVSRRSFDNGQTWGPLQVVYAKGNDTWGNPTLLVNNQGDGKIWLFLSWNDGEHSEFGGHGTIPITKHGERKVWSMYSTSESDGSTWSQPIDRTDSLQPKSFVWDAIGPGIGIQKIHPPNLRALVIPATSRNIFSLDEGETWQYTMVPPGTSEATVVEKLDGSLVRNDRSADSKSPKFRKISTGHLSNWTAPFKVDELLPDPHCEGSSLRYNEDTPNRIIFLNSASPTQRTQMTVRITYDEMRTWAVTRAIPQSGGQGKLGGYSSMVKTADFMVGALIEYTEVKDGKNGFSLQFHKFNLDWILDGSN